MTKKTGGFWGFIKSFFGFGNDDASPFSISRASDESIDEELKESYVYDEEKAQREAREMIAKSLEDEKTNPDDPDIFFQRATGHSILNENEKALEILDKILSIDPDYIDAYRLKASIYDDSENYEEVVNNLTRAISLHTEKTNDNEEQDFEVLQRIDDLLSRIDRREKIDDYQNRGAAHVYLKNFDAAIDDFSKAIEIDPTNDFSYSSRGEAYLETGNLGKALEDLNKAIEIEADYYNYSKRAQIYRQMGNLDIALRDISKAIEINKASDSEFAHLFDGYSQRAEIHMEKGDYNSAVPDFTHQIELDPELIEPYERRAAAYRALGMDSLAEADEQKAAELNAEYEEEEEVG